MISAYNTVKVVLQVGDQIPHVTPWELMQRAGNQMFGVTKINKVGKLQQRLLFVDTSEGKAAPVPPGAGDDEFGTSRRQAGTSDSTDPQKDGKDAAPCQAYLYNFDRWRRLRKKLPLLQLIQVEKTVRDDRQLALVFSSQGLHSVSGEVLSAMETTYTLIFSSSKVRAQFEAVLLAAHARTVQYKQQRDHASNWWLQDAFEVRNATTTRQAVGTSTSGAGGSGVSASGATATAAVNATDAATGVEHGSAPSANAPRASVSSWANFMTNSKSLAQRVVARPSVAPGTASGMPLRSTFIPISASRGDTVTDAASNPASISLGGSLRAATVAARFLQSTSARRGLVPSAAADAEQPPAGAAAGAPNAAGVPSFF
jgi:hypothetical protein